jgi:hypothetical protein
MPYTTLDIQLIMPYTQYMILRILYKLRMKKNGRFVRYYKDPTLNFWKPLSRHKTWNDAAFEDTDVFLWYLREYGIVIRTQIRNLK